MRCTPVIPFALCLLVAAPALAQSPAPDGASQVAPPADSPVPVGRLVLPEKTEIKLTLEKDLKSGADKAGETVPYEVDRDVYSPFPSHVLLIPAGAKAFGKVIKSSRRGMLGKSGKLEFTCEYVLAPDGTKVPLRAAPTKEKGRNNTGASVAIAVLAAPIALLMNGRDVTVHKGQEYTAYVDEDTDLPDPKGLAAEPPPAPQPATASAPEAGPPPPAPAGQTLFTLNDGLQLAGTIQSFDGTTYVVATANGSRSLSATSVKSMTSLPGVGK
jgi:hypothetical protein